MTFEITRRAQLESEKTGIEPQIVVEIDGFSTLFGAVSIKEIIKYGQAGLVYGPPSNQVYGGLSDIADQLDVINFDLGTTTSLKQNLRPDQGTSSSIQSFAVVLNDRNNQISRLISPGVEVTDILGRKARIYFGFVNSSWPEDYIILFRGFVDDVDSGPGNVKLIITHPDTKKKSELFPKAETTLDGAINASTTSITLDSTSDLFEPLIGPTGVADSAFRSYIRINDEIIQFTGISGSSLTGVVRGALSTTAASHSDGDTVESFYQLEDTAMILALKLMMSGTNGAFVEDVDVTHFVQTEGTSTQANGIFFNGVDVEKLYGLTVGDYATTTGASNAANNVTNGIIEQILQFDTGSAIVLEATDALGAAVSLVLETDSAAEIDFRSQYDVLPDGMTMDPDEVDVAEHIRLRDLFLSSFNYRFHIKDTIEGKSFIEKQLYAPASAFSVPRKARASVGIHTAPIPRENFQIFNKDNISEPEKIRLRRTLARHFFNTIIHKFEEDVLEEKFLRGTITTNVDSTNRIKVGRKTRVIEANGMRADLNGVVLANAAADRLLDRYKFGAEFFERIKTFFSAGFKTEVGDAVIMQFNDLNITNTQDGTRVKDQRFFEVINKTLNIKTGETTLSLVDTAFDGSQRYGLISRASKVNAATSASVFSVKSSFNSKFAIEGDKFKDFIGTGITVRTDDGTTRFDDTGIIKSVVGNEITLESPLSFTPLEDDIVELSEYNNATDTVRLLYAFLGDGSFDDGTDDYVFI